MPRDTQPKLQRNAFHSFLMVAQTGSIRKAAEGMGLAQSAVSRQIMAIEDELQTRLLERLPSGVALTPAGELFARHAHENKAQLERVRAEISTQLGLVDATIRVAVIEAFSEFLLPASIGAFRARHPGVSYQNFVGVTSAVVKSVREGSSDFGIVYNLPPAKDLNLHFSQRDPTLAIVNPAHPLAGRDSIDMLDLADQALALPARGTPIREDFDAAAARLGLSLRPVMETPSVPLMLEFAHRSDVLTVLPLTAAAGAIREGRVRALPLRETVFTARRIDIFSVTGWPLTAASEAFVRLVQGQLVETGS